MNWNGDGMWVTHHRPLIMPTAGINPQVDKFDKGQHVGFMVAPVDNAAGRFSAPWLSSKTPGNNDRVCHCPLALYTAKVNRCRFEVVSRCL